MEAQEDESSPEGQSAYGNILLFHLLMQKLVDQST
jgi:hypothetical protein